MDSWGWAHGGSPGAVSGSTPLSTLGVPLPRGPDVTVQHPTTTQASAGPSVAKCQEWGVSSLTQPVAGFLPPNLLALSRIGRTLTPWPPCLSCPPPTGQSPGHHRNSLRCPVLLSQPPTSPLATRPGWARGGPLGGRPWMPLARAWPWPPFQAKQAPLFLTVTLQEVRGLAWGCTARAGGAGLVPGPASLACTQEVSHLVGHSPVSHRCEVFNAEPGDPCFYCAGTLHVEVGWSSPPPPCAAPAGHSCGGCWRLALEWLCTPKIPWPSPPPPLGTRRSQRSVPAPVKPFKG